MPKVNSKLKAADPWLKWLIIAGTATYFVEVTTGISEGNSGHSVFWWIQSFIAVCFTVEYILRWVDDAHDQYRWHYPHSALGIIDLISILPFWIGCFLPLDWFQIIRTLRVFWLLKFFRYSRSLQLVSLEFRKEHERQLIRWPEK